jgi:zinc and cadmium transporter
MAGTIFYTILSVLLISLISFIGLLTLAINTKKLQKILLYLISFSAGALLGDAFLHLLPEIVEKNTFTLSISLYTLLGIAIFFVLEKFIHWQHCHLHLTEKNHVHPFAYTNLLGDVLHNFIDGIIIAASYLISIPVGIATTFAVAIHEIPQEIGDFGVLLHGGFSKSKALLLNFASALAALIGAVITLLIGASIENLESILIPIAAGGFIYIAASDLIPEIHKTTNIKKSIIQLIAFLLGIATMAALLLLD